MCPACRPAFCRGREIGDHRTRFPDRGRHAAAACTHDRDGLVANAPLCGLGLGRADMAGVFLAEQEHQAQDHLAGARDGARQRVVGGQCLFERRVQAAGVGVARCLQPFNGREQFAVFLLREKKCRAR